MTDQEKKKDEVSAVRCTTSAGPIAMEFHREWSPNGYDRAIELFERGFYDDSHFFRVVPKFLVQFGISYTTDQDLQKLGHAPILDDPRHEPEIPFEEGTISFAGSGDNSRTSQLFISYGKSESLGTQKWETPVGKVIEGMDHVRNLYSYGDGPPFGKGPAQGKIHSGRRYIEDNFPLLDRFNTCKVSRGVAPHHEWVEPKKIQEVARVIKEHKKPVPRLNETQMAGENSRITLFAAVGCLTLVFLLIYGYRHAGKKNRSKSY